jgi:hypothetical protein
LSQRNPHGKREERPGEGRVIDFEVLKIASTLIKSKLTSLGRALTTS